ncbi:unnamed protein product [Clavelina lepadiformis]|uniref:Uncharacterized protein n=1 Tax=Clavelina lepadiformis TaxID=159417 RepID=A0ABP0FKR8_CLALP
MKVIVAGYSKTGTKSMVVALNQLGYNVYDFFDHFWYHGDKWEKLLSNRGGSIEDFKEMYQSVDAVTDCPPNIFWEEILQAFPDAKVILTTRDEEQWYKSLLKQMQAFLNNYIYGFMQIVSPTGRKYFTFFRNVVRSLWGSDMRHPRDSCAVDNQMMIRKAFRQHGKYCEQNCPPGKLLVYDVRQGWAPLCKFLGKEIPDKPFPS